MDNGLEMVLIRKFFVFRSDHYLVVCVVDAYVVVLRGIGEVPDAPLKELVRVLPGEDGLRFVRSVAR